MARTNVAWGVVFALLLSAGALSAAAASVTAARAPSRRTLTNGHSLLQSRELWATVDVCNSVHEPDTVGIRGSMPGDGHAQDAMYMRFQLQYLEAKGNVWTNLAHGADSGWVAVGAARTARQGGSSFQLKPVNGQPAYTMRGLVTYRWKRGARVVHETTRTTSAGHRSVANADPPGYSAAQCTIG